MNDLTDEWFETNGWRRSDSGRRWVYDSLDLIFHRPTGTCRCRGIQISMFEMQVKVNAGK